jgi:molecular chaperone GrpE (heat shock protein)
MEEELSSLKHSNGLYESAKQELEDVLQTVENARRDAEEELARSKAEVGRMRKELTSRMEELREYAGVCGKL